MAEGKAADKQSRHDLVADAEAQGPVEHVVGEGDGSGEGDDVPAKEGEVHAVLTLRNAVTHGRYAAGDLGHGAPGAGGGPELLRIGLVGLMGAEHVVVGRHDGQISCLGAGQRVLVGLAAAGHAMGQVAAG